MCSRNGFATGRWCLLLVLSLASVMGRVHAQPSRPDWAVAEPATSGRMSVSTLPMDSSSSLYTPQIHAEAATRLPRVRAVEVSSVRQAPVAPAAATARTPDITLTGMVQSSAPEPTVNNTADSSAFYERDRSEPLESASAGPDSESGTDLIQLIEVLQWTVVVLMLAVVGALALKKFKPKGISIGNTTEIKHLASLPVKNLFQAHLLEITGQQFFVTTDRNGVKTVTAVNRWNDFETPVDTFQESAAASAVGQSRS